MDMQPFDDEVMTIIMGIKPDDPGMHGKLKEPCPTSDAIDFVIKIRDMCEEWLRSSGKDEEPDQPTENVDDGLSEEEEEEKA